MSEPETHNVGPTDPMVVMTLPEDPKLLIGFGRVAIAHAHLDHILKMTIKTICAITVKEAILALRGSGSRELRERIKKLAKQRLGDGVALVKLQALLGEARELTSERNELVHSLIVMDDQQTMWRHSEVGRLHDMPTEEQLRELALRIMELVQKLNEARIGQVREDGTREAGWLQVALDVRRRATSATEIAGR